MNITQFTMEEVRCFAERQEFNIRPLTFLVGENSTGKTTALACFHVLANYIRGLGIDFNFHPYSMGTFKDIVRNSKKDEKVFKLGCTFKDENGDVEGTFEFVEKSGGIEPVAKSVTVKFTDGEIVLNIDDTAERGIRVVPFDEERNHYHIDLHSAIFDATRPFLLLGRLPQVLDNLAQIGEGQSEGGKAFINYFSDKKYPWFETWEGPSVFSISPIRSRPERTYNPTRIFYDPEGSDIPMLLMEIQATDKKRWDALKAQLVDFGKRSDLFQNIDVKILGGSMGNPFQLKVKVRGPNSNIIDVGYGVSQILPILVHILDPSILRRYAYPGELPLLLLQQPEVHLHPRAQAELSSLLAGAANQGIRRFIIETHSDYMIDRARIEIRKGTIRPEDVSLIYLEPKGNVVKVHNISFDKMANMEGVPPHYGKFFMKEYRQLMGFED